MFTSFVYILFSLVFNSHVVRNNITAANISMKMGNVFLNISPPIQWAKGALSLAVKQQEHEADYSPPSSAEVKECVELYLYFPITPSCRGVQLRKAQRQLCLLPLL
jgi:hypothetical protein